MRIARGCALVAVCLGLCLQAGCGDGGTKTPVKLDFDGTWAACRNDGLDDFREVMTLAGTALHVDIVGHATADLTCDGDATPAESFDATVTFGAAEAVPFGGRTVQATQADLTIGGETVYSLVYRDETASPDVLHVGDDSGALDGTTPAKRPTTLQDLPRALQTAPVPADLTGTWKSCPVTNGNVMVLDAAAHTFDLKKFDGTCNEGTASEHLVGTFALAEPVYAGFGAITVTAFAVDLSITAGPTVATTLWVDREASPRRLYHGDDGLHGMDGSTPALRPRVLSGEAFLKE